MNKPIDLNERLAGDGAAMRGVDNALVMMVDDEQSLIDLTREFLAEAGYRRFVSTADASSAIAMLLRERPDVLLLDIKMPRVSGFDILGSMQADPMLKHIPAIVLTSADDAETKLRALELGATDFLRKPVDPSELALRLRNTLAAKAHEKHRLSAEVQHREAIRKAFSRYVSPRLTDKIIRDVANDSAPFKSEPERVDIVALFADLRGFTRITETVGVHVVVEMLNEYFSVLTDAAYQHDGTVFNMAGQSLLIGFNVPLPQPDALARAVRTAKDVIANFAPVSAAWRKRHGVVTGIGMGLCRGEAIIGNVGSPHFMSYTVIGDTVNTAARLMELARANEVLMSGALYESARDLMPIDGAQRAGRFALRGTPEPVEVYSITLS
jgi:adenylate cyclase